MYEALNQMLKPSRSQCKQRGRDINCQLQYAHTGWGQGTYTKLERGWKNISEEKMANLCSETQCSSGGESWEPQRWREVKQAASISVE